jgi:hypothetical protein
MEDMTTRNSETELECGETAAVSNSDACRTVIYAHRTCE